MTQPEGTKLVLMSEELMRQLGASRVDWGEPDEEGRYTPTVYADAEEVRLEKALERLTDTGSVWLNRKGARAVAQRLVAELQAPR